jgi:hypothetical protein
LKKEKEREEREEIKENCVEKGRLDNKKEKETGSSID